MIKDELLDAESILIKFGISYSNLILYRDEGLINSIKIGGRLFFDGTELRLLRDTLLLRECGYSIEEIRTHCSLFRKVGDRRIYNELVGRKAEEIDLAASRIKTFEPDSAERPNELPFPVESIKYLCCPECGSGMSLTNALIEDSKIRRGFLFCPKHPRKSFEISEGCINTGALTARRPDIHGPEVVPEEGRLGSQTDKLYESFDRFTGRLFDGFCSSLAGDDVPVRVLIYPGESLGFIEKVLKRLPEGSLLVVVMSDMVSPHDFFADIEYSGASDLLFLQGGVRELPFAKYFFDVFVDFYGSQTDFYFDSENSYPDSLSVYLRPGGIALGGLLCWYGVESSAAAGLARHERVMLKDYVCGRLNAAGLTGLRFELLDRLADSGDFFLKRPPSELASYYYIGVRSDEKL